MKSLEKLNKLADRFEQKLQKTAQEITQTGTTELFFDSDTNMQSYGNAIRNPKGPVFKVLNDYATKSEKSCSFDLKVNADPGKSAAWVLTVNPPALKAAVAAALNGEFVKIMKVSMADRQKTADAGAKKGAGSGTLNVGSLALDME